ncbi:hypothetical protein MUO98_08360, partial [Candidatus Bathyarchaeota archaeon]|nr:hypothetical protein [Candidatus Bathyarchaeota archaeon]
MSKLNPLGYVVLSDAMNAKVFGGGFVAKDPGPKKVSVVMEEMEGFGVKFPVNNPDNFFLEDFALPELRADSIKAHFDTISKEVCKDRVELMKEFAYTEIPEPPDKTKYFLYAGWVKYPFDGSPEVVDGIEESIGVFDCETFVQGSDFA